MTHEAQSARATSIGADGDHLDFGFGSEAVEALVLVAEAIGEAFGPGFGDLGFLKGDLDLVALAHEAHVTGEVDLAVCFPFHNKPSMGAATN